MIDVTGINGEMIIWGSLLVFSIGYSIKVHRDHKAAKAPPPAPDKPPGNQP